jgi:hypothetical protein
MAGNLTNEEQILVETMRKHQFGRIENLPVRDGQPVIEDLKVVRVSKLGGDNAVNVPVADFELKRAVCELLSEIEQLNNGTVVKLEFRQGLPFLLETSPSSADRRC